MRRVLELGVIRAGATTGWGRLGGCPTRDRRGDRVCRFDAEFDGGLVRSRVAGAGYRVLDAGEGKEQRLWCWRNSVLPSIMVTMNISI